MLPVVFLYGKVLISTKLIIAYDSKQANKGYNIISYSYLYRSYTIIMVDKWYMLSKV